MYLKMMYAPFDTVSYEENFIDNKWWKKYSCVAGNKTRSTKQKHSDPEVVRSKVPPPPPPRRIKDHDHEVSTKNVLPGDTISEAYTLYSIRQQMAISLNRMKDLEEQVKSIPKLQNELTQLRDEKERLQEELQKKEDYLLKSKEQSISQAGSQIISNQSPRLSSPITFTPQRVSPVALESLTVKLRSGSLSSNENTQSSPHVLKRDVAIMCTSHTRDVGVGNSPIITRSIGTSSTPAGDIFEKLYTKQEVNEFAQIHIEEYETQKRIYQKKNVVSVGTQMFSTPQKDLKNSAIQTLPEPIIQQFSIGIMARPSLRDVMVSCEPKTRSVATSDHRINDNFCDKCKVPKRSVGCGPELEEEKRKSVSLKLMDMPGRSLTFSLGENEKLNIKRKTIGTQSQWLTHSVGMQTSVPNSSVGIQNVPQFKSESTQCLVESASRQTDTNSLIEVRSVHVHTDKIPETPKPICTNSSCNTDRIKTVDNGVNTLPSVKTKHSSCNTEQLHKRDIGCGDIVKPHISIACADNYCDSCKEAIRHLAKDFCKTQPNSPSQVSGRESSRIPRPTHLTSPSPVRKKFMRQNTYTITPSPTPSPVAEKRLMTSSLNEKSSHTTSLDSDNLTSVSISSLPRNESNEMRQKQLLGKISSVDDSKIGDLCHGDSIGDIGENLIVKEETRVRISWSRENSPAPSTSTSSTVKTVVENNALSQGEKEADDVEPAKDVQEKTEVQPVSSQRSQREVQAMIMNQIVSQETVPRKKIYPSKEMQAALKVINDSLQKCSSKSSDYKSATAVVQIEWFHISSTDKADPLVVEDYLDCFEDFSTVLLKFIVNLVDNNGNTAMHYAVSHGNFDVVSILLDSKVCNVNQMNNAGYTCVMLVSLAKLKNSAHRTVVQRLFQMADVNIRAKKHCQTALMLAVSHGNLDMVEMLLAAGADINIQDEDGSTALMCAAEHGRVDIVKNLLSQSECDSLVQDVDGSTAFKIAWQAGHRDIGLLLYVHEQMMRSKMPSKPEQRTSSLSPRHHKRHPSE